ncbi:hypothetical protein BDN72DRAFT_845844 [Pluteus cervinus]|uniref:Uncharacterized protein n=1 Tax=Pluteus cervinus TaxID=181527 RepID=A0ACD3AID6_9AGAR|nr:hypothetical protein BDN72DRAFT_845844 [Pluteus cervinus]
MPLSRQQHVLVYDKAIREKKVHFSDPIPGGYSLFADWFNQGETGTKCRFATQHATTGAWILNGPPIDANLITTERHNQVEDDPELISLGIVLPSKGGVNRAFTQAMRERFLLSSSVPTPPQPVVQQPNHYHPYNHRGNRHRGTPFNPSRGRGGFGYSGRKAKAEQPDYSAPFFMKDDPNAVLFSPIPGLHATPSEDTTSQTPNPGAYSSLTNSYPDSSAISNAPSPMSISTTIGHGPVIPTSYMTRSQLPQFKKNKVDPVGEDVDAEGELEDYGDSVEKDVQMEEEDGEINIITETAVVEA